MSDLEGYGAEPSGVEAELRRRLGEHDFLVDLFQLSEQMGAFIETPPGAYLFSTLKSEVNAGLMSLLGANSLDEPRAKESWGRAKTSWAALSLIEETIRMGKSAGDMISEMDKVTP